MMDTSPFVYIGFLCLIVLGYLYEEYVGTNNQQDHVEDDFLFKSILDHEPRISAHHDVAKPLDIVPDSDE